jgi:hypothetical protein
MKNIIRFIGFFVALFFATTMSAQSNWAPTGSKTDTGGGTTTPTSYSTKAYVSFGDNAIISIYQGPINYQAYVKKTPESPWTLVAAQSNVMGSSTTDADVIIKQPDSYQLRIVVSFPSTASFDVFFSN